MKIIIQGLDYTVALDAARDLTIERKLNEPSACLLWLSLLSNGSLPMPSRYQSIMVSGDDGTVYFTGYIAVTPLPEYAGLGMEGPRYRIAIQALSEELLLDQLLMPPSAGSSGRTAAQLITGLVTRTGSSAISTLGVTLSAPVATFAFDKGANWSEAAGLVADSARASYRAVNGSLSLASIPGTVHTLNESDGSLNLAALGFTASVKRALANDVTVCGKLEPVAYVTEYFSGDGQTTSFYLSQDPFFPSTSEETIIRELFNEAQIDQRVWGVTGGPGYLAIGAGGLTMNGGNGIDGQTLLTWLDHVELGGTLLLETIGVTLSAGSVGVVGGIFNGLQNQASCIAGFQVTAQPGTGAVSIQAIVQGAAVGGTYPVNPANQYSLRLRVHCPESIRETAIYLSEGDNGPISAGGQSNAAPGYLKLEIESIIDGVGGTAVTLYDGMVSSLPPTALVVPASSINLLGTMRAVYLSNLGSGWVVSTPSGGGPFTRSLGTTAQLGECHVSRAGKLTFYTGYAPALGEQVAVSYRTIGRAVGRAVNTDSEQALAQAGLPSIATWIGSATNPPARSSADCRNAALVLELAASGSSALWSGSYKSTNFELNSDVWPGDALLLNAPSASLDAQVIVRSVKISYKASIPDLVYYEVIFANDWADDLAIKLSATVPSDTVLPAPVSPTVLANLNALTVTSISGGTVTINTGVTPPTGGGFEIRRRDFAFMPGEDADLVLRSAVPNLTFTRPTASEKFYVRMYDGSTPPNYSEFSTALFINLPLSA